MNKISLLATSIAIVLTGCGSDSSTPNQPTTFTLTAIDGYLQKAKVGVRTEEGCDTTELDKKTDSNGQVTLDTRYKEMPLCIEATAGETVDSTRGIVQSDFTLSAPSGSQVLNPMSDVVANMMEEDTTLTKTQAQQKVLDALVLTNPEIELDPSLVFGDYHHSSVVNDTQAQALNLVGELLVDNHGINLSQQVELIEKVADETVKAIDNNGGKLPLGYTPVVSVPSEGPITVSPNYRPIIIAPLDDISIEFGESVELSVVDHFEDENGDTLTYELAPLSGSLNGLAINTNTGFISGTPSTAGEFLYHIHAIDEQNARSYPLEFTVIVEAQNTPPVYDPDVKAEIQDEINTLLLTEGEEIVDVINVSNLFTDEDGDLLTYGASSSLDNANFYATVDDEIVSFVGLIPRSADAGAETLTVSAEDGVNPAVEVEFTLPKIDEAIDPPPPSPELGFTIEHFNNQNWKMGSFANNDGEIGHASLTRDGDDLAFCWGSNDDATQRYKTNISRLAVDQVLSSLNTLDEMTDYISSNDADCWPVDLRNGKLYSIEGNEELEYEMLYQNSDTTHGYQIILKIDGDELFWLDSTDTSFSSTLDADQKVAEGTTEYDMTVESEGNVDPDLFYSAGEYHYNTSNTFEYSSILPEGFYTPGTWEIIHDANNNDIVKVVESEEDQKTRLRYVQRNFGDFYIAIKWTQDGLSRTPAEYGLFSYDKQAMLDVLEENLPIISD